LRLRGQTTPFRPNTAPPIPHHEICQSDRPSGAFKSDRLLGITPRKLPNGRLIWPGDAVHRLLSDGAQEKQS